MLGALRNVPISVQEFAITRLFALQRPAKAAHLVTGERGELAALFYLRKRGYIITARSWRSARYPGDIDLTGWEGDALCFIEVKTRTRHDEAFTAESAVNMQKRHVLRRLARLYLRQVTRKPATVRFDILSIYALPGQPAQFQLFRGAFPLRNPA